jgi:diguanylate cyclase (GGDEF)-like protein
MPKNLLIVDDSPGLRKTIRSAVEPAGLFSGIYEAENGAHALEVLAHREIGFVITDLNMPVMDGFKLITAIRQGGPLEEIHQVPLIILSSENTSKDKVKGLSLGASDYILKPFDPEELLTRVRIHLKLKTLQEELLQKNRELEHLSLTDELTGLFNRRYFFSRMEEEFGRSGRYQFQISCMMIDVDYFKQINDTLGHQAGDVALQKIARILQVNTRIYNVTARLGGDEFIIGIMHGDTQGALILADRLRTFVYHTCFFEADQNLPSPTLSIGIAVYPAAGIRNLDDLINAADSALYKAKKIGRNRVVLHGQDLDEDQDGHAAHQSNQD